MNAAKRFLTGAAVAAGALGIGAGVFFACRQELSPGARSGTNGAERRPKAAKFDDGDYDFYFKNGAHVHGDCDGYNSETGGKTKIYEWSQSDINKWEKRLLAAGVKPEVYRAGILSDPVGDEGLYCWARFDTALLNGIGYTGRDTFTNDGSNDIAFVAAKGKTTKLERICALTYARAGEGFELHNSERHDFPDTEGASKNQRSRAAPSLLFVMYNQYRAEAAETALRNAGIRVLEVYRTENTNNSDRDNYIVADASDIDWFAYSE